MPVDPRWPGRPGPKKQARTRKQWAAEVEAAARTFGSGPFSVDELARAVDGAGRTLVVSLLHELADDGRVERAVVRCGAWAYQWVGGEPEGDRGEPVRGG